MLKPEYNLHGCRRRSLSLDDQSRDTKIEQVSDSMDVYDQYRRGSLLEKYGLDPLGEDNPGRKRKNRPMLAIKTIGLMKCNGDGLRSAMALTFDRSGEAFKHHSPVTRRRFSTQSAACVSPVNSRNNRLSIQEQLSSLAIQCASPGLPLSGMSSQMNAMIQQSREIELQQQRLIGKKRHCSKNQQELSILDNDSVSQTTCDYATIETVYPLTSSDHSPTSWSPSSNRSTNTE